MSIPTPDPRSLPPDPRLPSPSLYSQDVCVAALTSLYESLPHIASSDIRYPPAEGWPEITQASLQAVGLRKTDQVVELLRHLPYINGQFPWVAPDAYVVDYRKAVTERGTYPFRPLELSKALTGPPGEGNLVKPWVVEITSGFDAYGCSYLLDTMDGTVTRFVPTGCGSDEPHGLYGEDDPRNWRDSDHCDDRTRSVEEFVQMCKEKYRSLEWLGLPKQPKQPGVLFYSEDYRGEECRGLRRIYTEHGWPDEYRGEECRAEVERFLEEERRRRTAKVLAQLASQQ